MEISAQYKTKIEKMIVEIVIAHLEKEELDEDDLPIIGSFVMEGIDSIKTHEELVNFLSELTLRWPMFKSVQLIEEGEAKENKEGKVAENVQTLTKAGNIEEALKLAKSATNS